MKQGELRNQSPSVETIPAQNVNQIIYRCCTLLLARLINRQVEVFRSAQTIPILLSVWPASKCSRNGGVCLEENGHSRGNACELWGRICSCTDQGYGCDRYAIVPV